MGKGGVVFRDNVWFNFECLPRSEHWTTRRWHWHLKGHFGSGGRAGSTAGGVSSLTKSSPDPASSSIMKSRKPDWRKGRAQQAVTRSRERQADLMVLLAGEPGAQEDTLGGSLSVISVESTIISQFQRRKRKRGGGENKFSTCAGRRVRDLREFSLVGRRSEVKGCRVKHLGATI